MQSLLMGWLLTMQRLSLILLTFKVGFLPMTHVSVIFGMVISLLTRQHPQSLHSLTEINLAMKNEQQSKTNYWRGWQRTT